MKGRPVSTHQDPCDVVTREQHYTGHNVQIKKSTLFLTLRTIQTSLQTNSSIPTQKGYFKGNTVQTFFFSIRSLFPAIEGSSQSLSVHHVTAINNEHSMNFMTLDLPLTMGVSQKELPMGNEMHSYAQYLKLYQYKLFQ